MHLREFVNFGDENEIRSNLKECESELIGLASNLNTSRLLNERLFLLQKLVCYAGFQMKYLQQAYGFSTEFYAWIARNMFEIYLIVRSVLSSDENAKKFISRHAFDEIDILDGIKKIPESGHSKETTVIDKRIGVINDLVEKHGMTFSKAPRMAELAGETGLTNDYEGFYKFYSKYVHPSSWLILGDREKVHSSEYRNIFLIMAQFYAGLVAQVASDEIANLPREP